VALPARTLRPLDRGLGAVAALARERRLGAGDEPSRGDRPGAPRSRADPVHGHGRRSDREGRSLRADIPRGGRPGWPDDRHEADAPRRDHGPAPSRLGWLGAAARRGGRPRAPARSPRRTPAPGGDRRRSRLSGPGAARRAQAPRTRHQGAPTGRQRLRPDPAALPDRARLRPARALAPPVALLRGHHRKRPGLARGGFGRLPRLARGRLSGRISLRAPATPSAPTSPGSVHDAEDSWPDGATNRAIHPLGADIATSACFRS
jgi:hypothetical protein